MNDYIKKAIRSILVEFQERELPQPSERRIESPPHHPGVRKAWVLMGVRRSGKTWVVYQEMRRRQSLGFAKETNLYINFEDDRLNGFSVDDFQLILDVYFELYPQYIHSKDLFFCFDEIHVVEGWETFIRRLLDTEEAQICVTGSSAGMLSKELGTTLGGRAWPQEIFPYSFLEFLHEKKVLLSGSAKNEAQIRSLAAAYLVYGGFPEAVALPTELHTPLIQGYMDAVIMRDIVKRYNIQNVDVLQRFLLHILRQPAAPLSVTKIYKTFQSQGLKTGNNALYEYLSYLQDAYAVLTVPLFSLSERARQVNPPKVYCIDPGIITAYSIKPGFNQASRLENGVFIHLRRSYHNICYYKTKTGKEVDFIVTTSIGDLLLFQVCADLRQADTTFERETESLYEACKECGLQQGTLITTGEEETIQREGIQLHCIPFWRWASS